MSEMNDDKEKERRHFAAMMLAGMQSANPTIGLTTEIQARCAVEAAEALIAELDKTNE